MFYSCRPLAKPCRTSLSSWQGMVVEVLRALAMIATALLLRKRCDFSIAVNRGGADDCRTPNVARYSKDPRHSTLSEDARVSALCYLSSRYQKNNDFTLCGAKSEIVIRVPPIHSFIEPYYYINKSSMGIGPRGPLTFLSMSQNRGHSLRIMLRSCAFQQSTTLPHNVIATRS